MTRRKGIYSWEDEPSDGRRSEFRSTTASDWRQSTQSTFADPSRLEHRRARRRARERARHQTLKKLALLALLLIAIGVLAAWALAEPPGA